MLPNDVSATEAQRQIAQGARLVDVREEDEWNAGHVAGAVLIPLDSLQRRMAEIPKDQDVILICRSGRRSGKAQTYLFKQGYSRVANLTGGILAWDEAGLPLEHT